MKIAGPRVSPTDAQILWEGVVGSQGTFYESRSRAPTPSVFCGGRRRVALWTRSQSLASGATPTISADPQTGGDRGACALHAHLARRETYQRGRSVSRASATHAASGT